VADVKLNFPGRTTFQSALVFAAIALSPIAAEALSVPLPIPVPGLEVDGIWLADRLDGYGVLDGRRLLVRRGPHHGYILTLSRGCEQLGSSSRIGVSSHGNTVRPRFDAVTGRGASCQIRSIHRLNRQELKQSRALTRRVIR